MSAVLCVRMWNRSARTVVYVAGDIFYGAGEWNECHDEHFCSAQRLQQAVQHVWGLAVVCMRLWLNLVGLI